MTNSVTVTIPVPDSWHGVTNIQVDGRGVTFTGDAWSTISRDEWAEVSSQVDEALVYVQPAPEGTDDV